MAEQGAERGGGDGQQVEQERGPAVAERVEGAGQRVPGGVQDEAGREGTEHAGDGPDVGGVGTAVPEGELAQLRRQDGERAGGRDGDDGDRADRTGEDPAHGGPVVGGGAQRGQDGGDHGHRDHAVRHDPQQVGAAVRRVSDARQPRRRGLLAGERGQPGHHPVAHLVAQHEQQRPPGGPQGLAQPGPPPVPARPQPHPGGPQAGQQHQALGDDTGRRPGPEHGQVGGGEGRSAEVGAEHPDHDQVVEHRRPRHRREPPPGVEELAQHREQPVAEHLRQAQVRQQYGVLQLRTAVRGVRPYDERRGRHHQRRQHQQGGHQHRHQPVEVRRTAVRRLLGGAHQVGHQRGVQRAADQQHEQDVGHGVGHVVAVREHPRAEDGHQDRRADEAGGPGDHRPHRHHQTGR